MVTVDELPEAQTRLGASNDPNQIECLVNTAFDGYLTHFSPIGGESYSGRIFSAEPMKFLIPLPKPMSPREIALELQRLSKEARREKNLNFVWRPGWEIKAAEMHGAPVVIAWATWV